MNNVTFGGQRATGNVQRGEGVAAGWTYYETIGGGQGASQGAPGPSGVHVGMSNTRNTPIEVLEMEYPVRLKSYALRRGSGGGGRWSGGDGVIREFEALAPMEASILAERRLRARSEEHTSELQSPCNLVCRLLLEKKKRNNTCLVC